MSMWASSAGCLLCIAAAGAENCGAALCVREQLGNSAAEGSSGPGGPCTLVHPLTQTFPLGKKF